MKFSDKFPLFLIIIMVIAFGRLIPGPAAANELQLAGSYSANLDKIAGSRLGFRFERLDVTFPGWTFNPAVYLEASVNQFQALDGRAAELTGVALSPVLQWRLPVRQAQLYLEAGIGVSTFDGEIIHIRSVALKELLESYSRVTESITVDFHSTLFSTLWFRNYNLLIQFRNR